MTMYVPAAERAQWPSIREQMSVRLISSGELVHGSEGISPVRMDQPSAADETPLREVSAQSGDRAMLMQRLERLPRGHPSSLAADAGGNGIMGAGAADETEPVTGSTFGPDTVDMLRPAEPEDSALRHADADPLRALGSARETHPSEYQLSMERLDTAGVEVDLRPGSMSYSPSAAAGQPGRLILDPDASYGALVHEMSHFTDDEAAGFPGLRFWLEDPAVTAAGEERAYMAEIDYANSISETTIANRLTELMNERIRQLRGEGSE
jgi:hypothetical protein